jgi:gluconokinase
MVVILMGVAGSGKTTVGRRLADELGWISYDADDFHPPANVAMMRASIPLTDKEREPWLDALAALIRDLLIAGQSAALACSALKATYRARLGASARANPDAVQFVYLRIPPAVAEQRLSERHAHFMPATLVPSQFATLEEPTDAIVIDARLTPDEIVAAIRQALQC